MVLHGWLRKFGVVFAWPCMANSNVEGLMIAVKLELVKISLTTFVIKWPFQVSPCSWLKEAFDFVCCFLENMNKSYQWKRGSKFTFLNLFAWCCLGTGVLKEAAHELIRYWGDPCVVRPFTWTKSHNQKLLPQVFQIGEMYSWFLDHQRGLVVLQISSTSIKKETW